MVVIDPPFITKDVWEQYAKTAKALLKHSPLRGEEQIGDNQGTKEHYNLQQERRGLVLATTVAENQSIMEELFNAKPACFKPNIPKLVYQYNVFVNCIDESNILKKKNPEIRVED
jgi:hypothetical protein